MKYLKIILLVLAPIVLLGQTFTLGKYAITGGNTQRSDADRWNDRGVNILEFGADPTGVADSTAAIQAAIDSLFNTTQRTIYCPDGTYKTSLPIYLDAPNNLRTGDPQPWSSVYPGGYQFGMVVTFGGQTYISLINGNNNNQPNISPADWQVLPWNSRTTYSQGAYVTFGGYPWISLSNGNTNNTPASGSAFWQPTALTPAVFNFGYTFAGNLGQSAPQGGCVINAAFANAVALYAGPGNGTTVANITIQSNNFNYRGQLPSGGVGVCIPGGNGGSVRTLLENIVVNRFFTGYSTSCNVVNFQTASLGEENKYHNISASNCAIFLSIVGSQNDINDIQDSGEGCTNGIIALVGPSVAVTGGSYSTEFAASNSFSVSSTSAVTASGCIVCTYSFSTTIVSPDSNVTGCVSGTAPVTCVYNAWTLLTTHFGLIPLKMTAYNPGTHVASFQIPQSWSSYFFGLGTDATSSTDLSAEVQAAPTIYANEMVTTFSGPSFKVSHIHVEQSNCVQFFHDTSGIAGDTGNTFEHIRFNYNIGMGPDGNSPRQICQSSFPFIFVEGGGTNFEFRANQFGGGGSGAAITPINIDLSAGGGLGGVTCKFDLQGQGAYTGLGNVVVRVTPNNAGNNLYTPFSGGCEFSDDPYFAVNMNAEQQSMYSGVPFIGFRPAPWSHPRIPSATFTTLQSITSGNALGSYTAIDGSTIYSVLDYNSPAAAKLAQSVHQSFSYGQNLTTSNVPGLSWAKKGQSCVVLADANTLKTIFPGLSVTLTEDAPTKYVVTGVFGSLTLDGGTHAGYFTVYAPPPGSQCGTGTKTTVYTGTTIGQDSYVLKTLTLQ